jgi:hypothetical protein
MKKPRRWEIAVCGSGTIHLHYGTGSLHIRQEDFIDLAADLRRLAERLDPAAEIQGIQNKKGLLQ